MRCPIAKPIYRYDSAIIISTFDKNKQLVFVHCSIFAIYACAWLPSKKTAAATGIRITQYACRLLERGRWKGGGAWRRDCTRKAARLGRPPGKPVTLRQTQGWSDAEKSGARRAALGCFPVTKTKAAQG
jgi:hypothetical protein